MSLRDRLRKLESRASARRAAEAAARSETAAGSVGRGAEQAVAAPSSVEERSTDGVTIRTTRFPLAASHGHRSFAEVDACDAGRLGVVARVGAPLPPREAAFLDTETTDLGGGAGVYVFQVGLLTVVDEEVVVEQLLLEGPEHEPAFLAEVFDRLAAAGHLVSFFGKSFDRHRLDDRAALHGRGRPLENVPHLDLYHVGRRLFGRGLSRTRLRNFEEELLGVVRHDDLDGAECPDAWYDWLAGHDDGRLERVFRHNLIDVLSLLALTIDVDRSLREPRDPLEAASAGLLLADGGAAELARPHLERAVASLSPRTYRIDPEVRKSALLLARTERRGARFEEALGLLDRLAGADPGDPSPVLEAAKIAEHDLKDRARALALATELRSRWMLREGGARRADGLVDVAKRIRRLS